MFDDEPSAAPQQAMGNGTTGVHVLTVPPSRKVDIGDIHVPLPLLIGAIVMFAGGVFSVGLGWYKMGAHMGDAVVHPEPQAAVKGGGIAFSNEIQSVRTDMKEALETQHKATRKLLTEMRINCVRHGPGGLSCGVALPER